MADYVVWELRDKSTGECLDKNCFCDSSCMNDHFSDHPINISPDEELEEQTYSANENPIPETELACGWCDEDLLEGDY